MTRNPSDKSKKWMEFLEIPVRDGAGNHTRTITIGVVWREKREWDILGNKEDIMICAAYVEDFKIYFLVAVVKPKMTRNVNNQLPGDQFLEPVGSV